MGYVEASLQVQHADPLSLPKLHPVLHRIIELVLVLSCPFVDQDKFLAHPVGLTRLNAWYQQQWHNTLWLLPQQDGTNHSFGH